MKKTYRNRLPKGMEVENTNIRVENGEILVEVEFKEKFEPKDGDFLADINDDCVFIYSDKPALNKNCICSYCGEYGKNKGDIRIDFSNNWLSIKSCRSATPKEKVAFLERLKKECHKRWNAEKKCLEDIRWRAERWSKYYRVTTSGLFEVEECEETCSSISYLDYRCGNYFRTKEAAKKVADQIKEIFKNSKTE